jgi:hypothetical protein
VLACPAALSTVDCRLSTANARSRHRSSDGPNGLSRQVNARARKGTVPAAARSYAENLRVGEGRYPRGVPSRRGDEIEKPTNVDCQGREGDGRQPWGQLTGVIGRGIAGVIIYPAALPTRLSAFPLPNFPLGRNSEHHPHHHDGYAPGGRNLAAYSSHGVILKAPFRRLDPCFVGIVPPTHGTKRRTTDDRQRFRRHSALVGIARQGGTHPKPPVTSQSFPADCMGPHAGRGPRFGSILPGTSPRIRNQMA